MNCASSVLFFTIYLILSTGFSSCSHIRHTTPPESANPWMQHRSASIVLRNGNILDAFDAKVTMDSLVWTSPQNSLPNGVLISEVRYVLLRRTARCAADGLSVGALGGFSLGVLTGLISGDDWYFKAGEKAIIAGVFFSAIGGVVGLPIGFFVGNEKLVFEER